MRITLFEKNEQGGTEPTGIGVCLALVVFALVIWGAIACVRINADNDFKALFGIPRPETQVEAQVVSERLTETIVALNHEADIRWNRSAELDAKRTEVEFNLARARERIYAVTEQDYERLLREFAVAKDNAEKARRLTEEAQGRVLKACDEVDAVEDFTNATRPAPCPAPTGGGDFF